MSSIFPSRLAVQSLPQLPEILNGASRCFPKLPPFSSRIHASASTATAMETTRIRDREEATMTGKTLGIPETPDWKILPIPKTSGDVLGILTSKEFQQSVRSPLGVALSTYSALRTAYFIGQAFYTAQSINYRPTTGILKEGVPTDPLQLYRIVTERMSPLLGGIAELHRRDTENVKKGLYRKPYDMDPRHRQFNPGYIREGLNIFVQFAKDTIGRRERKGRTEVLETSEEAKRNKSLYPDYYLQNFHYQDGWLSEFSAESYEIATETLFLGAQDAMQRGSLIPLHYFMHGRIEKNTKFLDLACGTGRFLTFIKDNYPQLHTVGVDLSPFFLEKARKNMAYFREFDKRVNGGRSMGSSDYLQASAEKLPFESASLDVISCVYLFHELPPQARLNAVREMHRVLKKGGVVIFNDSIQLVDRPSYNFALFPENYHEPYFLSYVELDLENLFSEEGFCVESSSIHHMSKVMCFSKL